MSQICYPGGLPMEEEELRTDTSFIKDARLRSLCVQLEQAAEEANQYREEFNAIFALKKAFPRDQVIWLGIIASFGGAIAHQVAIIRRIKAQLSARLTE